MRKWIGRALFGVLLVSLMVLACVFIYKSNSGNLAPSSGTVTVLIKNKDGELVDQKRIAYSKGDTAYSLLEKEYQVTSIQSTYGHYLTGIANDNFKIETDGKTSWIWFEHAILKFGKTEKDTIDFSDYQEVEVTTGIDGWTLKDHMIIGITERDGTHSPSVFTDTVSFSNTKNIVSKVICISIVSCILLGLVIYAVLDSKKSSKITVRDLCILALMTVILFVQEEALSILPNIQFTFLLIAVYVKVFGFRKSMMIVSAHVLLDNLFMGSMTPMVMIPMYLGYILYMLLIYFVRNRRMGWIIFMGILGSLAYCYFFLIINALFLEVNVWAYWISDIPFEILLVLSTVFTLYYFYPILTRKLSMLYENTNEVDDIDNAEI